MQSKSAAMLAQQKLLNLKVLQKLDSGITEVLDIVGHITVYTFNQKNATWDRKEVEGTMFLVKRASDPQYQFIVMNRLSTTNLVETITSNFVMQVSEPYLLYRNAHGEVNGIWFYDKDERERICSKIQSILAGESAAPEGPSTSSTTTTPQQPLVNRIPMNGKVLDSRAIESQLLAPQQSQPPSHSDVQNQANQILQQLQYPPFAAQTVQSIESSLHDQLRRSSSNIPTAANNLSSNPVASLHAHMLSQIEASQVPQSQPSTQDDLSLEDKLASAFKQATIQPSLQHPQPVSPQMMPQAVVPLVPQVPQPVPTTQDNNTDLLTMLNNNLRASMTAIIAPQPAQKEPELKITKSQLKNVLVKLVQDDSFVDMVWNQCLLSQPESSN